MMTRTTLMALWFGGGGLLATWVAVSPDTGSLPGSRTAEQQITARSEQQAAQLSAESVQLRERTAAVTMRPSTRNPFRFNSPKLDSRAAAPVREVQAPEPAAAPAAPALPPLSLAGIAQNGGARTAIITSGTQMYLVSDGETVAGALTVVKVEAESVLLRDASGAEVRLQLQR